MHNFRPVNLLLPVLWVLGTPIAATTAQADDPGLDPRSLLEERCGACHRQLNSGSFSRIGEMRKTPEGWDRSIQRMELWHGVAISHDERAALVKFFSDTRGLAPSEAAAYRYGMEQTPGVVEREADQDLAVLCARCHSFAHVALQRRTREEWERLAHTHAGQWPTLEFQDKARDRRWWEMASGQAPETLAKRFPLESAAWTDWQRQARWSPVGEWRVRGQWPGGRAFAGILRVRGDGRDHFQSELDGLDADGNPITGSGNALIYTGYEWRGRASWNGQALKQVWALSDGGNTLGGRWFFEGQDSLGGHFEARRVQGEAGRVDAVLPGALRAGERRAVIIHGAGLPLEGGVSLGAGIVVTEVLSRSADRIHLVAEAAADLEEGPRSVRVGEVLASDALVAYREVGVLRVEPAMQIARVGGGPIAPVPAQFEAVGWIAGPDAKLGTEDDISLGRLDASWRVEAFDDIAAEMDDVSFAGTIDERGRFSPAEAGPNPERPFSTNNAGRLRVVATLPDQDLDGSAELVVTVQRWVDPIIR